MVTNDYALAVLLKIIQIQSPSPQKTQMDNIFGKMKNTTDSGLIHLCNKLNALESV